MTQEATENDRCLKTQLLLSINSQSPENISVEQVWSKQGYFSDERADFNIEKRNFSLLHQSGVSLNYQWR